MFGSPLSLRAKRFQHGRGFPGSGGIAKQGFGLQNLGMKLGKRGDRRVPF